MRFLRTSMKIGTLLEDILKTFSDMEPPEIWPSLLMAAIFQNGGKIQEFSVLSCVSSQKNSKLRKNFHTHTWNTTLKICFRYGTISDMA